MARKSTESELSLFTKLQEMGGTILKTSNLLDLLKDYKNPNAKIHSWIRSGVLVSLAKGCYIISPQFSRNPVSTFLVSNLLYGPSYISLLSSLSFHGLIPEAVYTIQGVCFQESKKITNQLGNFEYTHIPMDLFPPGVEFHTSSNGNLFWIASPTKAVCDSIYCERNLRIHSLNSLRTFLEDFWRIDLDSFTLDSDIIELFIQFGVKKEIYHLLFDLAKI